MIETKSKAVGRYTYHVKMLPCGVSRKLLRRLFEIAGPSFGALVEGAGGGSVPKSMLDVDMSNVSDAVTMLANSLSEEAMESVVSACFDGGQVEVQVGDKRKRVQGEMMEIHFAGHLDEMFRVIGFVLEVNYSDFFGDTGTLGKLFARGEAATPPDLSKSQSLAM